MWDEEWRNGYYSSSSGNFISDSSYVCCKNGIRVVPNAKYYVNITRAHLLCWYDDNDAFIGPDTVYSTPHEYTAPANARYMRFYVEPDYGNTYKHDITINYPSTDHDYHPGHVQTIPITFPSGTTVYGGTLELPSCVLTVTHASVTLTDDTATWSTATKSVQILRSNLPYPSKIPSSIQPLVCDRLKPATGPSNQNFACGLTSSTGNVRFYGENGVDYGSAAACITAIGYPTAIYPLDPVLTVQLTPTEVTTLLGQNNIWSDTGSSTVEYPADTKLYIDKKLAALVAALS